MLLAHLALLAPVLGAPVVRLEFGADAPLYLQARLAELLSTDAPSTLLRVDIGNTSLTSSLVPADETARLQDDGYILRSRGSALAVASRSPRGLAYGAFHVLRLLGHAWLHPMHMTAPANLTDRVLLSLEQDYNMTVNPAYSVRGSHVHAEHPNELCNLLNGFDAEGGYANRSAWVLAT